MPVGCSWPGHVFSPSVLYFLTGSGGCVSHQSVVVAL